MKYSKDDIIEALRCCSLNGRNSCETCPLREECEESPFASVPAKYALEVVNKLMHENRVLTEQRNTFRECALQTHAMVEGIRVKMDEGYEYSAAKQVAEMDMWRCIAAEKQALQDENERLTNKLIDLKKGTN
jgi:hypothetical protein